MLAILALANRRVVPIDQLIGGRLGRWTARSRGQAGRSRGKVPRREHRRRSGHVR
jgi:hypothetical protein